MRHRFKSESCDCRHFIHFDEQLQFGAAVFCDVTWRRRKIGNLILLQTVSVSEFKTRNGWTSEQEQCSVVEANCDQVESVIDCDRRRRRRRNTFRWQTRRSNEGRTAILVWLVLQSKPLFLSAAEGQRPRNYSSCCCLRLKAKDLGITRVDVVGFFISSMP